MADGSTGRAVGSVGGALARPHRGGTEAPSAPLPPTTGRCRPGGVRVGIGYGVRGSIGQNDGPGRFRAGDSPTGGPGASAPGRGSRDSRRGRRRTEGDRPWCGRRPRGGLMGHRWVVAINPHAGRRPVDSTRVTAALREIGVEADVEAPTTTSDMRRVVAEAAVAERVAVVGG